MCLQPPDPFLDYIMLNPVVYDTVFDACSAKSLVLLLRTCRTINESVKSYMRRAFNVDRLLSRYFKNPIAFRYLQACTGALISGSTALQLFDRSFYPESDLDVYVPTPWALRAGHFLLDEGYSFTPSTFQNANFEHAVSVPQVMDAAARYGTFRGIAGVFTFEKEQSDGGKVRVQIMVAVRSPIEVILGFHSTCVLNVIAFDKAYCLYPRATLEERITLVCTTRHDEIIEDVYARYIRRGWFLIRGFRSVPFYSSDPALSHFARYIDDGLSWSIPLVHEFSDEVEGINAWTGPLTHDPVSVSGWTMTARGECINDAAAIMFHRMENPELHYHYVFDSDAIVLTPSVATLINVAARSNAATLPDRHFVDNCFIELCQGYYQSVL